MAIIGVPMMSLDTDNPIVPRGSRDAHLTPELIALMGLPLTDTLNIRLVNAVEFILAVPLLV